MGKITLKEYLETNKKVDKFLNWDNFWENISVSSQIPLDWLIEHDPTCVIVGKEQEIRTIKSANYKAAIVELERERMFNDLRFLLLEIDYLRNKGFAAEINNKELKSKENKDSYDWVEGYKKVINELVDEGKYDRRKVLDYLFKRYPYILKDANIDYNLISERLKREFKDPVIVTFVGPKGSGKSFIQNILMDDYEKLCNKLGVRHFDYLIGRTDDSPKVIKLLGGEGIELVKNYDNKAENKRRVKKLIATFILVILAYPVFTFITSLSGDRLSGIWTWGSDSSALKELGQKIWGVRYEVISILGLSWIAKYVRRYLKDKSKLEGNRPVLLTSSDKVFPIYGGPLNIKDLIGRYRPNNNRPPQEWVIGGSLLSADGRGVIIEQLSETDQSEQATLAQIIQEGEIPIAEGEFRTDFNSLYYIGQNPDLMHEVKRALVDRLNTNEGDYVKNEVAKNKITKRSFFIFLEYWRNFREGKPFDLDAYEELLKISTMFSENVNTLTINRRFLAIVDGAIDIARLHKNSSVSKSDVVESFVDRKSRIEQSLYDRLKKYRYSVPLNTDDLEVGRVNMLSFLTDESMFKDIRDPYLREEMANEEGVGYILAVSTEVRLSSSNFIKLLTPDTWSDAVKNYYSEILKSLLSGFISDYKYSITIDISDALVEDKSLILAMYIATVSAIKNKKIDQSKILMCSIDMNGVLRQVKRPNRRVFSSFDELKEVVVPEINFSDRIDEKYYNISFLKVEKLLDLLNIMGFEK